jgi:hypothetical protein
MGNNIKMDLMKNEYEDVNWIHLLHDRGKCCSFVDTVTNLA